jgi:hypothetical protein
MTISKGFFRFAAICALVTALTTIVVHAVPNLYAQYDTFIKRVDLRNNWIYITRFWFVLLHCVFVVVSMYAVGIRRLRAAPVLLPLGFLSFVVFAYTEWLRTTLAIFALNRTWRSAYAAANEESVKQFTEAFINAFAGFNDAFFYIFFTFFLIGCACYGFAYIHLSGSERKIGWLFILWAATGVPAWIDEVLLTNLSAYFAWMGWYFQCIARVIIGIWLWKTAKPIDLFSD